METFKVGTASYPHLPVALKILSYGSILKQKTSSAEYVAVQNLLYA